jgi:ethanolamine utilization protein EutA
MNVDIGGGTSKIAVCEGGEVVDMTAADIGARVLAFDADGRLARIEEAGRRFAAEVGLELELGEKPAADRLDAMAERMAERLFEILSSSAPSPASRALLRLAPLRNEREPDAVTFSGGVAEYVYGRESAAFGDLGPRLAKAIRARMESWGPRVESPDQSIRATVIGASQYTIQVSGSTIFVSPHDALPLRNVPVIAPELPLDDEALDGSRIASSISLALRRLDLQAGATPVALCYRWRGSATHARLDVFCRGVLAGLPKLLERGLPLILVGESDVGGLIGIHCREDLRVRNPIVSVDGVVLKEFDFIDIGGLLEASGAVPVVIKSLVFPATTALGRYKARS